MLCRAMKSLEKALEPSMRAARALGPKTGIPTRWGEVGLDMDIYGRKNDGFEGGTFAEVGFNAIDEGLFRSRKNEIDLPKTFTPDSKA